MLRESVQQGTLKTFLSTVFIILIGLLLLLLIASFVLVYFLKGLWLGFLVRQLWYPKDKFLLFVYSDSPNWKEYIEQKILLRVAANAIVVNWSERNQWQWGKTLEVKIFQHWAGVARYITQGKKDWDGKEFCPIAIVFRPWWRPKVIKFWQAFKEFKHGKESHLKKCEQELFELLKIKSL